MQTTISKWGNSLALRLPSHIVKGTRLVEGASVDIEIEDGSIRVTPARKKFKLADLLANEPPRQPSQEIDWGIPEGDEVW